MYWCSLLTGDSCGTAKMAELLVDGPALCGSTVNEYGADVDGVMACWRRGVSERLSEVDWN